MRQEESATRLLLLSQLVEVAEGMEAKRLRGETMGAYWAYAIK